MKSQSDESLSVRQRLRKRLTEGPMLVAPGIYDAYGALFVQQAGFEAAYMTGNGVSASLLGRPDVGLVDLTLFAAHAHRAAACVDIPLICDADTGYGNAVNVQHTVREFEAAGVAAIHLEDQVLPKRCGHLPGLAACRRACRSTWARSKRRLPRGAIPTSSSSRAPMPRPDTGSTKRYGVARLTARPAPMCVFVELKSSPDITRAT